MWQIEGLSTRLVVLGVRPVLGKGRRKVVVSMWRNVVAIAAVFGGIHGLSRSINVVGAKCGPYKTQVHRKSPSRVPEEGLVNENGHVQVHAIEQSKTEVSNPEPVGVATSFVDETLDVDGSNVYSM